MMDDIEISKELSEAVDRVIDFLANCEQPHIEAGIDELRAMGYDAVVDIFRYRLARAIKGETALC